MFPIEHYIPALRQCYNCGKLGHSRKWCKDEERCLTCTDLRHPQGERCPKTPKCINCTGEHNALNKDCLRREEAIEVNEIIARDNVPYITAKRSQEKRKKGEVPIKNDRNFPTLKVVNNKSHNYQSKVQSSYDRPGSSAWNTPLNSNPEPGKRFRNAQGQGVDSRVWRGSARIRDQLERLSQSLERLPKVDKFFDRLWETLEMHKLAVMDTRTPNQPTAQQGDQTLTIDDCDMSEEEEF